jgi:hypothetical protein
VRSGREVGAKEESMVKNYPSGTCTLHFLRTANAHMKDVRDGREGGREGGRERPRTLG